MMGSNLLRKWFPHATYPFVVSAPMFLSSNGTLAASVSNAGGLASLPIGVGFLTTLTSSSAFIENASSLLQKHKPCLVWLFCPDPTTPTVHGSIIPHLNKLGSSWGLKVFVQVGSVSAARDAIQEGADGVVAQGIDAGGHQWANGVGLISIVPEVVDMIHSEFSGREIAVIAAGGVVDGRGVAASLALGADGVCMGTRFAVTDEAPVPTYVKDAIIAASDGASATVKSTVHDDIQGSNFFPPLYDGRALVGKSWQDHMAGLPVEENATRHKAAKAAGDNSRNIVFASSAIGTIKLKGSAGDVVRTVQKEAKSVIDRLRTAAA